MRPGSSLATPARPLALALALVASLALVRPARAAGGTYEIVGLDGKAYAASALVFSREGLKVVTPAGPRTLAPSSIDWYETFHRNIRTSATNVVVFKTGSLLRFDRFELTDGLVHLTVASGGRISVSESLIDFERSVREGAMVKLPEDAGGSLAISRPAEGGAWTASDDEAAAEETPTGPRSRRGVSLAARRRAAGGAPPPPTAAEEGMDAPAESPEELGQAPMDVRPPPDGTAGGTDGGNRSPFSSRRPNFGSRPDSPGGGSGGDTQESGQVVITVGTDYSGPIGGLQLTLQYPPNLQVVESGGGSGFFTGFAGNWLATTNTLVPGQIRIAGAPPPDSSIGGGEFLRIPLVYTGTPPSRQAFRITEMIATGPNSTNIPEFHATLDVSPP